MTRFNSFGISAYYRRERNLPVAKRLFCLLQYVILGWLVCGLLIQPLYAAPAPDSLKLIDRLGGAALDVVVQDHYAFVGFSFELAVLELSDPTRPQRVAWLPISANKMAVAEQHLYILGRDGLHLVDISQPTAPKLIGFLATAEGLASIAIVDDLVYGLDVHGGFYVIDVAQPNAVRLVGKMKLDARTEGVSVQNGYAYVTAYHNLFVIDIDHPAKPILIRTLPFNHLLQDIAIAGQTAYVTGNGSLSIFDLTDPVHPRQYGQIKLGGYTNDVVIVGDYAFVANGSAGVRVVNITDQSQPVLTSALSLPGVALGIAAWQSNVYVADLAGSLYVFSAQPPGHLTQVGVYHTPGIAQQITAYENFLYLIGGLQGTFEIVDVSDPQELTALGSFPTLSPLQHIAIQENVAYLVDQHGGLTVLDISNPVHPTQVAFLPLHAEIMSMALVKSWLLLTTTEGNWLHVDVALPSSPILNKPCTSSITLQALATSRHATYVTSGASLYRLDPMEPCDTRHKQALKFAATITHLYLVENTAYLALHRQGLAIVDLTDPLRPARRSLIKLKEDVTDLVVLDGLAFVTAGDGGLHVFDITQPANPQEVAVYQTSAFAYSVWVQNRTIYVGVGYAGLLALEFSK